MTCSTRGKRRKLTRAVLVSALLITVTPLVTGGLSEAVASTPPGVSFVGAGERHSVALKADGTVWAWGDNAYGQLGDGTTRASAVPVRVAGLTGVTRIAAGNWHTVAIRGDGTVWAWGRNDSGQLGNGTTTASSVPVQVSSVSSATWVAAGGAHSLARISDGTVRAWGANTYGQLGDGTTTNRTTAVTVSGLTGVVDLSAGEAHSLALRSDNTVRAWGRNWYGQLGDGTTTNRTTPVTVSGLTSVWSIAAGGDHSLASRSDGTVRAWGRNSYGQLGDGTTFSRTTPVSVPGVSDVDGVAAGLYHSFAIGSSGTLAWGRNLEGQLGDGTKVSRTLPVKTSEVDPVRMDGGSFHSLAVVGDVFDNEAWAFAWGSSTYGRTGDVPRSLSAGPREAFPRQVFGLTGFTSVAAGETHSLARRFDGTVWGSGNNVDGQLGSGNTSPTKTLVQVSGLTDAREVAAGGFHSLALLRDGSVKAWGHNGLGQVGDGTTINRSSPASVSGLSNVVGVTAGRFHSLAVKSDGTVWAWGYNFSGQLGDGTTTMRKVPVQVSGLTGVVAVAGGEDHSLALKSNGTVWAWGGNASGQLGDGTTTMRKAPVQVAGTAAAVEVAAGHRFSMAALSSGQLTAWGANDSGQLGTGAPGALSPVRLPVGAGVTEVHDAWHLDAGSFHASVVRDGGTVASWGFNAYGQLGDATKTDRPTPTPAYRLPGMHRVASGAFHGLAVSADGTLWSWGHGVDGQLATDTTETLAVPVAVEPVLAPDFVVAADKPVLETVPTQAASTTVTVTSNSAWSSASVSASVTGVPSGSSATVSSGSGTLGTASSWTTTVTVTPNGSQVKDFSVEVKVCGSGVCRAIPVFVVVSPVHKAVGPYASHVLADEPVSYWRLDETTGALATDEQGRNDGAISAGVTLGASPAVTEGRSMSFNGSGGHVDLARPASLTPNHFTIEAWVRPSSLNSNWRVVYRARWYGAGLQLGTANQIEGFAHLGPSGASRVTLLGPPLAQGRWHHVVLTKGASTAVLYVDGAPVATGATAGLGSTFYALGGIAIGRDGDFAGGYFAGLVDEVAVYDRALPATRVSAHYLVGVG